MDEEESSLPEIPVIINALKRGGKMNLKEAIDALLSGREITPDAREQLTGFDPESLREELGSLRSKLEEQENAKLSAEELLKKQLNAALSEKEELLEKHKSLERAARISQLAAESGCEDPDYLDFLASKEKVDLQDNGAVSEFISRTLQNRPNFFRTSLHPGSGTGAQFNELQHTRPEPGSDRISRIVSSLDSAPEFC